MKKVVFGIIALVGLALVMPAQAQAPGVASEGDDPTVSVAAIFGKVFRLVDGFGDTFRLRLTKTGTRPPSGTIETDAVACSGTSSYDGNGTFTGLAIHLSYFNPSDPEFCVPFVIDCVVNLSTKTCSGTFTNQDGSGGPILLSRP